MNEEKMERVIGILKKVSVGDFQEWDHELNASLQEFEKESELLFSLMTLETNANALAGLPPAHAHESGEERKQCPECQEWNKVFAAAYEKLSSNPQPLEELKGEVALFSEWFTRAKAAMLPGVDALKKAIKSGDLPLPPEHLGTHKSQEEVLACDICHGWIRRRDAIMQEALGHRKSEE
jgi:hypothetical protein